MKAEEIRFRGIPTPFILSITTTIIFRGGSLRLLPFPEPPIKNPKDPPIYKKENKVSIYR